MPALSSTSMRCGEISVIYIYIAKESKMRVIRIIIVKLLFIVTTILSVPCFSNQAEKTAFDYYQSGEYEQAYFLYKNMALTGDKDAQFNIGVMHLKGQYVDSDKVDAYAWIKLAADGGKDKYATLVAKLNQRFSGKEKSAAEGALSEARKLGWDSESVERRLSVYKKSKVWSGEYHL